VKGFSKIGSLLLVAQAGFEPRSIFLISACRVARITGMSRQSSADIKFLSPEPVNVILWSKGFRDVINIERLS
jgi:hypothetical protein